MKSKLKKLILNLKKMKKVVLIDFPIPKPKYDGYTLAPYYLKNFVYSNPANLVTHAISPILVQDHTFGSSSKLLISFIYQHLI